MCGIAGIKRMGVDSTPIGYDQITQLLMGIEHRGIDATGICLQRQDGKLSWIKKDEAAWQFVSSGKTKKFIEENLTDEVMTCILHTRAWTCGPPTNQANNHPLTVGKVAVVHNGMIGNHHALFSQTKLKRAGDVDSDIIRAILDEYGLTPEGAKQLNALNGSAAIAAISSEQPDHLLLGRSGNPLVIAALGEPNWLMWASEKDAIHAASRAWLRKWNQWFRDNSSGAMFNPVEQEKLMLWTSEGVQWESSFSTYGGQRRQIVYRNYDNKPDKDKRKQEEANRKNLVQIEAQRLPEMQLEEKPVRMKCRNLTCGLLIKFRPHHEKIPMYKLECPKCGMRLGDQA